MATTHIENKPRVITPRASRRNEILAILLLAVGLLLSLCLISAAFYPNDPSWNAAGQTETHNWAGSIGANVAATVLQFIGLAAYLLPLLLFAAAWRRFRTTSIHGSWSRIVGLVVLVISASALLSISRVHPLFDSSVQPGGLLGAIVAQGLVSGLNTVGATILLVAIAATGLLLATNFSFIRLYVSVIAAIGTRFAFVHAVPERLKAWRQTRREQAQLRKEKELALKTEREAARNVLKQTLNLSPADRIAEFMKEPSKTKAEFTSVVRGEASTQIEPRASAAAASAGAATQGATVVQAYSGRRSIFPGAGGGIALDEEAHLEEMVKGASVLRLKAEAPATANYPSTLHDA
jgi:DNA segregation ATPase FtsK/SpoIIIE-like protein